MIFVSSVPPFLSEPTPGSVQQAVRYMQRVDVRDYPHLLALVCRRWHGVARASQALHSFMFVDVEDAYDFQQDSAYYEAYLARSGTRPLTLSINGMQRTCLDLLAASPFQDHLPRLRWACIDMYVYELAGEDEDATGCDVFPLFPGVETPLLETVHVDLGQDGGYFSTEGAHEYFSSLGGDAVDEDDRILRHAPRLVSFSMDRFDPEGLWTPLSLKNAGLDYATLTCLRLPYVQLRVVEWFELLVLLPVLEVFSCRVFNVEDEEGEEMAEEEEEDDTNGDGTSEHARSESSLSGEDVQSGVDGSNTNAGLLTLPHLTCLSIFSDSEIWGPTYPLDARTGVGEFLAGLVLPSLTAFGLKTNDFRSAPDEEESTAATSAVPFLTFERFLPPALQALVQRSGCEVHELTLDTPFMRLHDVVRLLKILPELRALHLDLNMHACQDAGKLLGRLARRSEGGALDLVPKLTQLVLDNQEKDVHHGQGAVPLSELLTFVGERWPVGWTDWQIASVRAVVSEDLENIEKDGASEEGKGKVQEFSIPEHWKDLRSVRRRGDIELVMEYLDPKE
ncbi:uncharacterized protein SCHCODRAFT_02638537 [Schizophyllum commune H4-8]|nr:uncharacterized protein SCHCODRAFT_02638537 [Schizophyllum commune H4-8]KAI5887623.1 hypothetical protein SCHCODRAFT_02638537 [Schizophyllum commune H4-8]